MAVERHAGVSTRDDLRWSLGRERHQQRDLRVEVQVRASSHPPIQCTPKHARINAETQGVDEAPSRLARPLCGMRAFLYFLGITALLAMANAAPIGAQAEPRLGEMLASADQAWGAGKYNDALDRYQAVLRQDPRRRGLCFVSPRFSPGATISIGLLRCLDITYALRRATTTAESRSLERWRGAVSTISPSLCRTASSRVTLGSATRRCSPHKQWLGAATFTVQSSDTAGGWPPMPTTRPPGLHSRRLGAGPIGQTKLVRHCCERSAPILATPPAREQLEWTNVALTPSFEPTVSSTNDSDDNRSTTYTMRGGWAAPWNARLFAEGSYRVADLTALHGTAATLRASSSWTPLDGQWTMRGELVLHVSMPPMEPVCLVPAGSNRSSPRDCRVALRRVSR